MARGVYYGENDSNDGSDGQDSHSNEGADNPVLKAYCKRRRFAVGIIWIYWEEEFTGLPFPDIQFPHTIA
jgi:hypothetical protein